MPLAKRSLTALLLLALAGAAVLTFDLRRPPRDQWTTRATLGLIHGYQRLVSPRMPVLGIRCRFTPTCSRYAEAVIARDGALRGGWLTARRLLRCGPWTPMGTVDPP